MLGGRNVKMFPDNVRVGIVASIKPHLSVEKLYRLVQALLKGNQVPWHFCTSAQYFDYSK